MEIYNTVNLQSPKRVAKYKKINKKVARKMYNSGCTLLLLPCKVSETVLYEDSAWIKPTEVSMIKCEDVFDKVINEYEYYNCTAELGRYTHYYVSYEEVEKYHMCYLMCD